MIRYIIAAMLLSAPVLAEETHLLDPNMHIPVFGVDASPDPEYNRLVDICIHHRIDTGLIRPDHTSVYAPAEYNKPCHSLEAKWNLWVAAIRQQLAEQKDKKDASDLANLKAFNK